MSYNLQANNRSINGTFGAPILIPASIVCWMKLSAIDWALTSQRYVVTLSEDIASVNPSLRMSQVNADSDRVSATTRGASGNDRNAHLSFTPNAYDDIWVPVIAVFSADNRRTIYIENSSNSNVNTVDDPVGVLIDTIRIGASAAGFSNARGLIAEVAIFDKELTTAEIDMLQTGPGAGVQPYTIAPNDCIGYWSLSTDQLDHPSEAPIGPIITVVNGVYTVDHPLIQSSSNVAPNNNVPMPDQIVEQGVAYGPFDVKPYWTGTPAPTYSQTGLPNGLAISTDGLITGVPTGGYS